MMQSSNENAKASRGIEDCCPCLPAALLPPHTSRWISGCHAWKPLPRRILTVEAGCDKRSRVFGVVALWICDLREHGLTVCHGAVCPSCCRGWITAASRSAAPEQRSTRSRRRSSSNCRRTADGLIASLARAVRLSEWAVRWRVQRLLDTGVMRIVAARGPLQVGFPRHTLIGVRIGGETDSVAPWPNSTKSATS